MFAKIFLWVGIALIVIGWVEFAGEAVKRLSDGQDAERFPERHKAARYRRNRCRLTMIGGIALIIISLFI